MKTCVAIVLLSPLFAGCSGSVLDAGTTGSGDAGGAASTSEGGPGTTSDVVDNSPAGNCAALVYGTPIVPATDDDCMSIALGKWALCPDAQDAATPALPLSPGATMGDGVEFFIEGGMLGYSILDRGDGGDLVRSSSPLEFGLVDGPSTWTGASCHYWTAPAGDPGQEWGWTVVRFSDPKTMLLGGFTYVPAS